MSEGDQKSEGWENEGTLEIRSILFVRSKLLTAALILVFAPAEADTGVAISDSAIVDTRVDATSVAVAGPVAVVALDTREYYGNSGLGDSRLVALDTRGTVGSGLVVSGASNVPAGSQTAYRALMNAPGGGTVDVTDSCSFSLAGGAPAFAGIGGATLFVNRDAPAGTVSIRATYQNAAGQIASPPFPVSIGATFFASASASAAGGGSYTVTLDGSAAGGTAPYTFRWDTNGDGTYGDVIGQHSSFSLSSQGGSYRIGLEVTDAASGVALASFVLEIDKPLVPQQPQRIKPVGHVGSGTMYGADGHIFNFNPARATNGFVVVTHGLRGSGFDDWIKDLAQRIESRVTAEKGGPPNIAVYDWSDFADPSGEVDPYALAALEILDSVRLGLGAWNAAKLGLDAMHRWIFKQELKTAIGLDFGSEGLALGADFAIDAYYVRRIAQSHGTVLASWIWMQARAGLIDPDRPVHLIGHSAGGFLVGECANWLKQHPLQDGRVVIVDRATMLDTPFPISTHFTRLPNPNVVEQVLSSAWGGFEEPGAQRVSPGSYYLRTELTGWSTRWETDERGHGLAYRWYSRTVEPMDEGDGAFLDGLADGGFDLSPLLTGKVGGAGDASAMAAGLAGLSSLSLQSSAEAALAEEALDGFETFGDVAETGGSYTITEAADAGIFRDWSVPLDADFLTFRFRFAQAGDGDFLHVRFGDVADLYIGLDTEISRDGFTMIDVPVDALAGMDGILMFTLVSRGAANAIVEIDQITLHRVDDYDLDGLGFAEELAMGTSPILHDSDDDGLSDYDEAYGTRTDPLVADTDGDGQGDASENAAGMDPHDPTSRFRVATVMKEGAGGVTLGWTSVAGRSYRVIRSEDLTRLTFTVVASGIVAPGPMTTWTDSSPGSGKAMFYWVETE